MDSREVRLLRKRAGDEADILSESPNLIADDRVIKFSINLPLSLYAKIHKRAKQKYGGRKSMWIREVLEREVAQDAPVTFKQLIAEVEQRRIEHHTFAEEIEFKKALLVAWMRKKLSHRAERHLDPPKRYHGLGDGLQAVTSKAVRFKAHKEKMLDSAYGI